MEPFPEHIGRMLQKREQSSNQVGRPQLFDGTEIESHTITMPKKIWQRLKQPFSLSIYEKLQKA